MDMEGNIKIQLKEIEQQWNGDRDLDQGKITCFFKKKKVMKFKMSENAKNFLDEKPLASH